MAVYANTMGSMNSGMTIRQVNETLQGPVVQILSQFVPELKALPRDHAYERTLDDIPLLERCFAAFREQRDKFNAVLLDSSRQVVTTDTQPLFCGRTLDQVVAMIVRTAAKRYFRRTLTPGRYRPVTADRLRTEMHDKGFAHRATSSLRDMRGNARHSGTHIKEPPRSRADELYDAIKENLLHEWQVPLVPTYANMTPNLVRALGEKILEIRTIEQLRKVAADPTEAARLFDLPENQDNGDSATFIAAASAGRKDERARLSEILSSDGKRLRPEAFAPVLRRPEVRAQIVTDGHIPHLADALRQVGALPAKLLVAELGLRTDQLAVILLLSHQMMGSEVFGRIFGQPGEVELVMRLTQKARIAGISQRSPLPCCATFVRELFASFR